MIELNKVYNENCLDTMKRMDDNSVDLVVTSPPYNMRTRVRNGQYTTREKSEHFSKKYKHFSDSLPIKEYYSFHLKVLQELLRVSKTIIWNIQIVTGSKEAIFKLIGVFNKNIKDVIVWDKGFGQPAMHHKCLNKATELLLVFENDAKAGRVFNRAYFDRGTVSDIWRINRASSIKIDGLNAIFPDLLVGQCIKYFSKENDIVYDPFFGSGTTGLVAHRLNRKFIGSEISKECCKIAEKRLIVTKQGDLFNND